MKKRFYIWNYSLFDTEGIAPAYAPSTWNLNNWDKLWIVYFSSVKIGYFTSKILHVCLRSCSKQSQKRFCAKIYKHLKNKKLRSSQSIRSWPKVYDPGWKLANLIESIRPFTENSRPFIRKFTILIDFDFSNQKSLKLHDY